VVLATLGYVPRTDAADYDRIAVSLAEHGHFPTTLLAAPGGPTAYRPPLFPALLAVLDRVVGTGSAGTRWEAGRLLEAVLGAVVVALICVVGARVWDRRVGLVAGALASVFPPLVLVGSALMSEPLFIALMLGAVLAALEHRDSPHRARWAVVTGALAGLTALTRSNGILLLIPLWFLLWFRRPRLTRASLTAPAVAVLAALVMLVPWTVRNALVLHAFIPISTESGYVVDGTYNRYVARETTYPALWTPPVAEIDQERAVNPHIDEQQLSSRLDRQALHYATAHPGFIAKVVRFSVIRTLGLTGSGFERFLAPFESYPAWLASLSVYASWLVGLLALAGAFTTAARRAPPALWAVPATVVLSFIFVEGSIRFRSPADPFVLLLAALALSGAWSRR
jgi:4-amino-4-deoxy-L-arabinose transferase-like glycosyltransferase